MPAHGEIERVGTSLSNKCERQDKNTGCTYTHTRPKTHLSVDSSSTWCIPPRTEYMCTCYTRQELPTLSPPSRFVLPVLCKNIARRMAAWDELSTIKINKTSLNMNARNQSPFAWQDCFDEYLLGEVIQSPCLSLFLSSSPAFLSSILPICQPLRLWLSTIAWMPSYLSIPACWSSGFLARPSLSFFSLSLSFFDLCRHDDNYMDNTKIYIYLHTSHNFLYKHVYEK